MTTKQTKGKAAAQDVAALLRARNPILWVITREEARAEDLLIEAAKAVKFLAHTWDCGQGAAEPNGDALQVGSADPGEMIDAIMTRARTEKSRDVWIMRDLPGWLAGLAGIKTLRQLRNFARLAPSIELESQQAVIILTTEAKVPDELSGHATVIEWPLPDREEIAEALDGTIKSLPESMRATAAPNGTRDAAIDAAIGLTMEEAQACFARSLVQSKTIDPKLVASEKKRVIAKSGLLEWIDPIKGGLDAVGGLEELKAWLLSRKLAWSPKAREYGLPAPKGVLIGGIPGTGKSLTAKAVSSAWSAPLLKLDLGALKSKYVGESEGNLRKAFKTIEAIGRCVVWIDEIEKALAGATQGAADGGVSSDALGALLGWMQDRQSEAFVIATANDVESLPPELLRKGRFDEVFWVDLPTAQERVSVLKAALASNGRQPLGQAAMESVAAACKDFTGSEIAALVPEAMFRAFADSGRELDTADLLEVAYKVVSLSKTAPEKIARLRKWGQDKARPASAVEKAQAGVGRQLDIG